MADDGIRDAALKAWELQEGAKRIPIWVDCDTGHDDAFALLLASHTPKLHLLGTSTVHGNSSLPNTTLNTLRILESLGRRHVPVYPGAAKPFCRSPAYAPDIHGASGLDGTTILPAPMAQAGIEGQAVTEMYAAISKTERGTAWLVATGALTNVALLFAVYPQLVGHIAGLSIMGGAVGGFFTHAPLGRLRQRLPLFPRLSRELPAGMPDDSSLSSAQLAALLREKSLIEGDFEDAEVIRLLEAARGNFGNTTPVAEFNIYCDPEAAQTIFSNAELAAKTTLIPLDVTHQVLANAGVIEFLSGISGAAPDHTGTTAGVETTTTSPLRHLFMEILLFFAQTYEREFGMTQGPPLHDPIAVAAAFAPDLFDDNEGERYEVHIVREGDDSAFVRRRGRGHVGQCGRTIARMVQKGEKGIRIPRTLRVEEFWKMIDFALAEAEKVSPLSF